MSDKLNLAEIEQRAKRTERRLIDAGLDHTITDDIFALLACVAAPTPPTTPAAAARDALVAAAVKWDLNGTDENWAALKFATRDYREALAAQEPTP